MASLGLPTKIPTLGISAWSLLCLQWQCSHGSCSTWHLPPQSVIEPELQLSKGYSFLCAEPPRGSGGAASSPEVPGPRDRVHQPLSWVWCRFAALCSLSRLLGHPTTTAAPLACSPLSDTTRCAVRPHHGYPMKDPEPSGARGNIFNGSAHFPAFGIPWYNQALSCSSKPPEHRQKKFQAIILMIEPQTRVYNMLGQKFYFSGLRARYLATRGTLCQNTSPPIMEGDRTNITLELCYSWLKCRTLKDYILFITNYQMKLQSPAFITVFSTQLKERERSHDKLIKQQLINHILNHPT